MSIVGLNPETGLSIDGLDHLRQSIRDILLTPLKARVMRRAYGSALFDLIDTNITPLAQAQIYAATVEALRKWEPRLKVTRVSWDRTSPHNLAADQIALSIEGEYLPDGREVHLDGIVL
jgi:phage baseplate assembly protein W